MKKIMGERVKLIIREEVPFSSIEKTIEIEEAVDRIFNKESVVFEFPEQKVIAERYTDCQTKGLDQAERYLEYKIIKVR